MLPTGGLPDTNPRGMIIALILLFLVIIIAGALFYQSQEQQIRDSVTSELSSIALLKVDQIAAWRSERLGDADVLSRNRILIDGVREYLASPDPARQQKILAMFGQINTSYHYRNVLLVDPEGRVKVSLDPSDTAISPGLEKQLAGSLATHNAVLSDLIVGNDNQTPQMYAIAPLVATDNGNTGIVGAVILTINPATDLYPLVQSWPVPSESAETLLVEREDDHVLYLNELRHQHNTALNLTIPLSRTDLPAVKAVLGTTGAFTGRDYRGIEVLSVLEPVTGSPWFMVAKVDTAEAFSSWRSSSILIVVLVAGTLAGAMIVLALLWQRRQKQYFRSLYDAETGRREEEQRNRERLEMLLKLAEMESAGEQELMDFVLDAGCRLTSSPLAFIGVISPDESVFDITAWSKSAMKDCTVSASPIHFPIAKAGIWAEAVRQRKPIIVNDYAALVAGKKGLPEGYVPITRFVSVPIFESQRIVMVFAVANKETEYTPLDVDNLTLLMQGAWNQLRKRKADEALRQKSTDLEAAYEEITATNEELRANYEELAQSQQALTESEERVKKKLDAILSPAGDIGMLDLADVIDIQAIQLLMDYFFSLTNVGVGIIDLHGKVLIGTGWQDICTKFHRVHPETCRNCTESDLILSSGVTPGTFRMYKCRNNMWDIVTPITVGDTHIGNLFLGQFFFDDEMIDYELFRAQAHRYGFDEAEYLAALDRVPRWSREKVDTIMSFYSGFARMVSSLSYRNIQQARLVTDRDNLLKNLAAAQQQYRDLFANVSIGILRSTPGPRGQIVEANPAVLRIFEADSREQFLAVPASDLYSDEDQRRRISEEILANGAIREMEVRLRTLKGRMIWGRITSTRQISDSGEVYFDNTIEDITKRKAAEEALWRSWEYLQAFIRTAQYIPNLTPRQDILAETGRVLVSFFGADLVGFFEPGKDGGIEGHHWILPDGVPGTAVLTRETETIIAGVLETGFLAAHQIDIPKQYALVFLPIIRENQTAAVMLVGHRTSNPLPKELLNIYLAVAGLVRDITQRKSAEELLRRFNEELEQQVTIRTEELHAANDYLQNLLDYANTPIIVWDPAFRITRFNHAFERLAGRSEKEVVGQPLEILFPETSREASLDLIRKTASGERWEAVEIPIKHLSGETRTVLWNSANIVDPQGTLISTIAQGQDITDRKRAEEALRETNEYLQNLINYANAPIIVWDPEFRITRFNRAFEHLTGITEQEAAGKHLSILFPEMSRDASLALIQKTIEGERWEVVEIPIKHRSGEVRIVLWNSATIVNPEGRIISIIAQGTDITERKKAEEALKTNEYKFQTLADFTYDWAYWIDTDFRMIYTSPSCEQITGYSPEDFMGNPDLMITIVHPYDREIYLKHRSEVHEKPATGVLEFRILHRDGSVRWLGHVCRPIFGSEGRFLGTRVSNRDITDRKAMERQREALIMDLEQKNAELGRFMYTVSHDLKSPLITIKGFAGLLEDDAQRSDPVQLKKDIHRITAAADIMQELLGDVLELSRIGRVVSPLEKTSFGTIAREAVDLLAGPLAERGITVEILPDLPDVFVDHVRIREVMVNLVENAIKFLGDQQDPVIRIGVDRSGDIPVFFVQDNGIGINPRYLDRIFNLFERLDTSSPGSGVGLTIVRRIIEVHGGKIWAESEGPGKGTTFRFTLPGVPAGTPDHDPS